MWKVKRTIHRQIMQWLTAKATVTYHNLRCSKAHDTLPCIWPDTTRHSNNSSSNNSSKMMSKTKRRCTGHRMSRSSSSFTVEEAIIFIITINKSTRMTMTMCMMKFKTKNEQRSQTKSDVDSSQVIKIIRYNVMNTKRSRAQNHLKYKLTTNTQLKNKSSQNGQSGLDKHY